jgi:hypothetical protein
MNYTSRSPKKLISLLLRCARPTAPERGASFIELAIALPVLLLFLIGTVQLGRLLSQLPWSSSINYQSALAGSQNPENVGIDAMSDTFNMLREAHLTPVGDNRRANWVDEAELELTPGPGGTMYNPVNRTLQTGSWGVATSIFSYLSLRFTMRYVAPLLLTNPVMNLGDLSQFANAGGGNCYYNCDGVMSCSGPPNPPNSPCVPQGVPTPGSVCGPSHSDGRCPG